MADDTKVEKKTWRQLAAEVAQEEDSPKLAELTDKLLLAMEEQPGLADARFKPGTNRPVKLRSS